MNPFSFVLNSKYARVDVGSLSPNDAALYVILGFLRDGYTSGFNDGNPFAYVRDIVNTHAAGTVFGRWLSETLNSAIEAWNQGRR